MNPYPSYKESGVEWIGEIPSGWKVGKLYQYGELLSGSTPSRSVPEYWDNGDIPWMSSGEVNKKIIRSIDGYITTLGHEKSNTPILPKKTIMIGLNGQGKTKGTVGILEIETTCNQSLCGIIFKRNIDPYFQYFYLESQYLNLRGLVGEGKREGISVSFLKRYGILIPPLQEQQQISNYLDHKTQQIDSLIEMSQQKIELLKEQRTSLINHMVTKGLNPDVEMKDSGVEWIGEILRGWEVSKFNFYIEIRHGHQFREYDFTDEGIKIIKITQLHKNGYLDISNCSFIDHSRFDEFSEIVIEENDTLMCLTGGTIGKIIRVGKVDEPLLQNYRVGHFSSKDTDKIIDDYIFWIMTSEVINGQIFYEIRETGQPNIGMEDFGKMKICLPSIKEQQQIVDHLDKGTTKIDSTIEKETQRINLLKEYRQSLISNVVTGKVDVREEVLV
jgi:type I restriction enzyme S subunit